MPTAFAARIDDLGALVVVAAVAVPPAGAGHQAARVRGQLVDAGAGDQLGPVAQRARPVHQPRVRLGPLGQPIMQVPQRRQRWSPGRSRLAIAFVPGHQCQPSAFMPRAARRPTLPIGMGGSSSRSIGGVSGSPSRPLTPIVRATRS